MTLFFLESLVARACRCGQSLGRYRSDGVFVDFTGPSRILGLSNRDYTRSLIEPVIPWVTNYHWFPIISTPEHHVLHLSKEDFERIVPDHTALPEASQGSSN